MDLPLPILLGALQTSPVFHTETCQNVRWVLLVINPQYWHKITSPAKSYPQKTIHYSLLTANNQHDQHTHKHIWVDEKRSNVELPKTFSGVLLCHWKSGASRDCQNYEGSANREVCNLLSPGLEEHHLSHLNISLKAMCTIYTLHLPFSLPSSQLKVWPAYLWAGIESIYDNLRASWSAKTKASWSTL